MSNHSLTHSPLHIENYKTYELEILVVTLIHLDVQRKTIFGCSNFKEVLKRGI